MTSEESARTDGRRLRTARTRAAIARALVALANEGQASPSKEQIAERAGVSARAVFIHYPNVLDLVRVELDDTLRAIDEPHPYHAGDGFEQRLGIFVERGMHMRERMAPVRAMASTLPSLNEPLRLANARIADHLLIEIDRAFAPEFARLDPVGRKDCAIAIAALLGPVNWDEVAKLCAAAGRDVTAFHTSAIRRLLAGS